MTNSKATVKIYGREYTIVGEKSRERIVKAAGFVDKKMHEAAGLYKLSNVTDITVLASVNISDEYFEMKNELDELKALLKSYEDQVKHFSNEWDACKRGIEEQKKDVEIAQADKDILSNELADIRRKYKELEQNFFDLKIENVNLKD